ncbi:MAG: hypothetical protein ACR5LC_07475 [Symbiopectobacterium sp.]|uniref:hypothetical protein n=1 Tax=Symbiopectobacterium sp. TaxID=2952789 RepID=UPI003F2D049B
MPSGPHYVRTLVWRQNRPCSDSILPPPSSHCRTNWYRLKHSKAAPAIRCFTDLLPQGNNSQHVTQFLRQEFGHTELKALMQPQLQRVLTMLQTPPDAAPLNAASGRAPALATTLVQNALTNVATHAATTALLQRPLSSVEQNSLNQMVGRLSALLGKPTEKSGHH